MMSRFCSRSFRRSSLFNNNSRRRRSYRRSFRSRSRSYCFKVWFRSLFEPKQNLVKLLKWKYIFGKKTIWELSFYHKLWFSKSYIFASQCRRLYISNYEFYENSMKCKFEISGCKDLEDIGKFEFVTKTKFLCIYIDEFFRKKSNKDYKIYWKHWK